MIKRPQLLANWIVPSSNFHQIIGVANIII